MHSADGWDDAEGASVVATLGDFNIGEMIRREADARRGVVGHVLRLEGDEVTGIVGGRWAFVFSNFRGVIFTLQVLNDRRDLGDLIEADESIHLGHDTGEIFGETL